MKQFIISGVLGILTFLGINSTEDIIAKTETNRSITDSKNHIIKYEETQDYVIGYVKEIIREEKFEVAKSESKLFEFVRVEYTLENGIKKDVLVELTKGQNFNLEDRVKVGNKNNWEKNSKSYDYIEQY
ncbi:hypothetical protein OCF61_29940 [Bacillus cereus]|nr:hypothetical protein [Bacillus cereus]